MGTETGTTPPANTPGAPGEPTKTVEQTTPPQPTDPKPPASDTPNAGPGTKEGKEAAAPAGAPDGAKDGPSGDGKSDPPAELTLTFPDGYEPNAELVTQFRELATTHGLSQDAAQALVDLQLANEKAGYDEAMAALEQARQDNLAACRSDGGRDFDQKVGVANKALNLNPAAGEIFKRAGIDTHPEVVRLLYRAGLGVAEDRSPRSQPPGISDQEAKLRARVPKMFEGK